MVQESFRGKYWLCVECREFVPDESSICECGHERYARSGKYAGIHVSVLPPGLQGDKMYVHRQNGKQVMDSMQANQRKKELQRVKERSARRAPRPVVI